MPLPKTNQEQLKTAIKLLLEAVGEDTSRPGIKDTPDRVVKLYNDILDGNFTPIGEMTSFEEEEMSSGAVMVHGVPFYGFCEHHLLPFLGTFGMAYIPNGKLLGLSKLVRIFRHGTKMFSIQERITEEAVVNLMEISGATGAICYVRAEHLCMTLRGVKSPGSFTTTIAHRGVFSEDVALRNEFLQECHLR